MVTKEQIESIKRLEEGQDPNKLVADRMEFLGRLLSVSRSEIESAKKPETVKRGRPAKEVQRQRRFTSGLGSCREVVRVA